MSDRMAKHAQRIVVLGAGQIGSVMAEMLAEQGHSVTLADATFASGGSLSAPAVEAVPIDAADRKSLHAIMLDRDIVVSALPYFLNKEVAAVAVETGTHYFDLTEDVATANFIKDIGKSADVALVPQCGLAPGFCCVLGADMARRFDKVHSVKMRVGALPLYPTNALRYNVTWSMDGLINEYCNPCEILLDGQSVQVPALEGVESVMIDGVAYEAFNTSGGLGTLAESLAGTVGEMSYKTLRYPGHVEIMRLLLRGLSLANDRPTMRRILERAAPFTRRDVVVVFVTGVGEKRGRLEEESMVLRYYGNEQRSAIQMTTAAGCVSMIELFLEGHLPGKGFVRQEDADLATYLATRARALLKMGGMSIASAQ